jgi:hypothetical protein
MKTYKGVPNFTLKINEKVYKSYRSFFTTHKDFAVNKDTDYDVLMEAAGNMLASCSYNLHVGGTYRVGVFTRNIGNERGCKTKVKAAVLTVRVKVTGKATAVVIDDTKDAAYTQYLTHNVTIPNGKTYSDFVITDGVVARKALVMAQFKKLYENHSPFSGNATHVQRMNDELDCLIERMSEIKVPQYKLD